VKNPDPRQKTLCTTLANHEVVVLAAYLAGAESSLADTEDIAIKANELAPGRFSWRKHKEQINIDAVRKRLWDATKPEKGAYLIGSEKIGWRLTKAGFDFAHRHISAGNAAQPNKARASQVERTAHTREIKRMMAMCPPQRILGAFVERCGLGRVEDSFVLANSGSGAAPREDSAEGLMLRVLDEHGPVMDGEAFAEKCIAAGMNATTFYLYRINSPVICALGKNVYCKVGTNVSPGTVEDIVGRRRAVVRFSDHGWTSAGRLWCGIELTRQVITSGGIRLPAFVADFVQGEWQVVLPDGSDYGTVVCRGVFIWSFRNAFALLGAEPSDLTAFEFNLKSRRVLVRVGGAGLFEAIQDPESANAVERLEEA